MKAISADTSEDMLEVKEILVSLSSMGDETLEELEELKMKVLIESQMLDEVGEYP